MLTEALKEQFTHTWRLSHRPLTHMLMRSQMKFWKPTKYFWTAEAEVAGDLI